MRALVLIFLVPLFTSAATHEIPELGAIVVEAMKPGLLNQITSEAADEFVRRDLAEALTLIPGVSLQRTGARAETMVTVRGFDLRQVPVLIDGIPVYVPYDGYADLGRFTVPGAADIEVAKGISPVLAGPNALGGLINVVTRRPVERFEGSIRGGFFGEGGSEAGIAAGGREEKFYWQFDLSYLEQDGFRLSDDFDPVATEDGGRRENSYREDTRLSGRIAWTPGIDDEYVLGFWLQRGEKGTPPYTGNDPAIRPRFWQWPQWDKDTLYLLTRTALGTDNTLETRLHFDQFQNVLEAYDSASYNTQARPSSFTSFYDDWTAGGSVTLENRSFKDLRLATAVHYKRDHHEEMNRGQPLFTFEDETASFGVEAERSFSTGTSVTAGVSHDWREIREAVDTNTGADIDGDQVSSWNPQLVVEQTFTGEIRGHLGFARKSRFPTIKDRYSYRLGLAIPNPDLERETANHFDIGIDGSADNGRFEWSAGLFLSRIEDAIQRVDRVAFTPGGAALFQLQNVGEVEHCGLEVAAGAKWTEAIETGLRYAWIDTENLTNPGIKVFGTPEHELLLFAKLQIHENLRLTPAYICTTTRDVTSTGKQVDPYLKLDLMAEATLPKDIVLGFGVTNLLDRDQELDEGFPEEGRSYFVNLRYEF